MRIAITGISIEMMLSSPLPTESKDLQAYSAEEMWSQDLWMIRGMLARLDEEPDVEPVPLSWTTALPGGSMTAESYAGVKAQVLDGMAAQGPFDGVLLANHGALEVAGLGRDADTDFVEAIRAAVGPDIPIGVSLDLHGDMTEGLLRAGTVFSVLRTAPHRDDAETGRRAADQLLQVIRTGIRPAKAAVKIPILVPGETAVTALPPARQLYGCLPDYDSVPGMMEANILLGFAWNDRPWTSVTAFAVSEGDAELANAQALDLARRIWAERAEFRLRMETAGLSEGLELAAGSAARPVFVSDSGDNTTAGAPGDLTTVLQAALDAGLANTVVAGITAPETVRKLSAAGPGATVELDLGSEHVSAPATHRTVRAEVIAAAPELELGGFQPYRSREGAWAVARIGGILATFHDSPVGITTPAHFRAMGIDPEAHDIYVVKLGYLHPQLEDVAARHILLTSPGCSALDLSALEWSKIDRPMWPLDTEDDWDAATALYVCDG
ncbi:M81 family metallopeptidase [Pseudoruegeria sp. HB172150]|uniref:M81 family metallopeptidase n=1 Tax=Pseudoruegeria sp. HB172150 TaxID=2721164 RepID=UPI001556EBA5|nr:M81 family metallopeptidase [Pseudoruegeria sp. HB172150]